ncbi:DUF930 domain-containing protein [Rhizobium sp. DKSPLA3]|uniref:DUF930 domain-containing protein n=1 Tax=Rhizobium quercicola TaxID=2901226 RepID=A0A9X1T3C0_9HYPH|nr:DUF930 domain-containing protein [Rhizobium quercicola]MCD7111804.1 DUF930 domain-containing protein [Rhizobium quercicola]
MSVTVTSDSPQRRFDRPLLAILVSLALHAAIVAPFLLRLPETTPEAPAEPSVTVEIVPEPETTPKPPEPAPEAAKAEKAARSPPAAAKAEPASTPPPPTPTPAPAPVEPTPPAAPSRPFEASAAQEPDAPPDPVDLPAPEGEAKQADSAPTEPVAAPPATAASGPADAPVTEPAPGGAALSTPAPVAKQTETPAAAPEILAGAATSGEGAGKAVPSVSPTPASEPPPADEEPQPPRDTALLKPDRRDAGQTPAAPSPESADDRPMTPGEQAAYVPATPAIPQAKPAPAPKPAKTFYSRNILADPRVRGALDKLPPEARLVQICSIEALEQARNASTAFVPEIMKMFGKNGGVITGQHLSARGGAIRSRGVWREITFDCTANATFDTITAFRFALGETIPRSAWASRRLPAD